MKDSNIGPCERAEDLVAFLYGEASEIEAKSFEQHLLSCAACRSDSVAFSQIRGSLVAWRKDSLGSVSSRAFTTQSMSADVKRVEERRPSARAALRGFFTLSPIWMKGATAFAAVLFFVFAGLAIAHVFEQPSYGVAEVPRIPIDGHSAVEVKALVELGVQEEMAKLGVAQRPNRAVEVGIRESGPLRATKKSGAAGSSSSEVVSASDPKSHRRRPLTRAERDQLAADLRLISARDEEDLDLLGDRLNR